MSLLGLAAPYDAQVYGLASKSLASRGSWANASVGRRAVARGHWLNAASGVGRWLGDSPCASGVGPWCMAGLAGWAGLGWLDLLAGWLGWLAGPGWAGLGLLVGLAGWLGWLARWLVGLL